MGESEMGDGRWEIGDGRWEMGDRRWEMGDGRSEIGDGRCEALKSQRSGILQREKTIFDSCSNTLCGDKQLHLPIKKIKLR